MEFCVYFLLLYLLSTAAVAQAIIIDECDAAGNADIADSNPNPSLTCSAVDRSLWVTWSIQQPGEIDRRQIGECIYWSLDRPDANCTLERGFQGSGFSMKREGRFTSTLYFNYKQFKEGTVIYCATHPFGPLTSCKVFFIGAYKLQDYPNGVIEVPKDGTVNVTCTGMTSSQNMYWTMNFKDKSERRINCPAVRTTGTSNCEREYSGATAVRSGNESVLTLSQDGFTYWDSAIVKCSKSDNVTQAELQVNFVSPFKLGSLRGSWLYVRRGKESFVSCDGPSSSHSMYWTVELRNGTVRRTDCTPYKTHGWTCPPNEIEGFTGHRFSSGSYSLELTDNDGDNNTYLDGAVVTCSSQFNVSRDQCDIKVTWEPVGTLKLDNSTCPSLVITETDATESNVNCRCFLDPSDQLGSPAAHVRWYTPFKTWINQELVYSKPDLLSQSSQEDAAGYSVLRDGNFVLANNGSVYRHYCRLEWYGSLGGSGPQVLQELSYTIIVYVNPASSSPHVAAIVGGVVGAVVLITVIAIILVVFFVRKRR